MSHKINVGSGTDAQSYDLDDLLLKSTVTSYYVNANSASGYVKIKLIDTNEYLVINYGTVTNINGSATVSYASAADYTYKTAPNIFVQEMLKAGVSTSASSTSNDCNVYSYWDPKYDSDTSVVRNSSFGLYAKTTGANCNWIAIGLSKY